MNYVDELISEVVKLGHPKELGYMIAKNLHSENMIYRMTEYLKNVKPNSAEEIVDEMLALMTIKNAWIEKKRTEYSNQKYNEYLNSDLREYDE